MYPLCFIHWPLNILPLWLNYFIFLSVSSGDHQPPQSHEYACYENTGQNIQGMFTSKSHLIDVRTILVYNTYWVTCWNATLRLFRQCYDLMR